MHQYTTRGIVCEDTLEKSCVSKNDETAPVNKLNWKTSKKLVFN